MKQTMKQAVRWLAGLMVLLMMVGMATTVWASDADNSLYSLGITTEGAEVTPDFSYDIWEYEVTVPAGTTELTLDPVPSNSNAQIVSVTGTTLDENSGGTVAITVQAPNGTQFSYMLYVSASEEAAEQVTEAEVQTEAQTEAQTETEAETEDDRYIKVDRNTLEEAEATIVSLKEEIAEYQETISLYTKIMYALIAAAIILLFIVINLILRRRDLKAKLDDYRSYGYDSEQDEDGASPASSGGRGYVPATPAGHTDADAAQSRSASSGHAPYTDDGLSVAPQVSSGRRRTLPAYEESQTADGQEAVKKAVKKNASAAAAAKKSTGEAKSAGAPKRADQTTGTEQSSRSDAAKTADTAAKTAGRRSADSEAQAGGTKTAQSGSAAAESGSGPAEAKKPARPGRGRRGSSGSSSAGGSDSEGEGIEINMVDL